MNSIGSIPASSYAGSQARTASASMGKDDFLKLLVTQLANQDPLNPMDNQAFSSQLAQFSSLEQMANINETLKTGLDADQALAGALQSGLAADLIGREVTVVDDRALLSEGAASLRWEADGEPARVQLEIRSELGVLVRSFEAPDPAAALASWDGRDDNGQVLPDGRYRLAVSAWDAAGESLAARPLWRGTIETVRFRLGEAWLVAEGLEFSLGQVSEVGLSTPAEDSPATPRVQARRSDENGIDW
jgi:flagellar basal-body rod modification protein FlgD